METIGLEELAKKLEAELLFYMGENYRGLETRCERAAGEGEKSETLLIHMTDRKEHLSGMEGIDLTEILAGRTAIPEEEIQTVLKEAAALCREKYTLYTKEEEKLAAELLRVRTACPKDQIILFPAEKAGTADCVYRRKGGVFFYYGVKLEPRTEKELRFLPYLKKSLLQCWDVSEEELYRNAKENMRSQHYEIQEERDYFVIRNEDAVFGGTELIREDGALAVLAEKQKEDLIVLFLSPDELIAAAESKADALREAAEAIGKSGFLFYYDRQMKEIAANAVEKEELRCRRKQGVLDAAERNQLEGKGI